MPGQISYGFESLVKLGTRRSKTKITLLRWIFFYHAKSRHRSSVFLRPNFRVHFFLFRINFKGISYIKLKAISIFWWTSFLVRFIFKGISYIKLKAISNLIVVRSLIFEGIYFIKNIIFKGISFIKCPSLARAVF